MKTPKDEYYPDYASHTTAERFDDARKYLAKMQAVPILLIGVIVGDAPHKGAMITMNFQGKTEREVYELLKQIVADIESAGRV